MNMLRIGVYFNIGLNGDVAISDNKWTGDSGVSKKDVKFSYQGWNKTTIKTTIIFTQYKRFISPLHVINFILFYKDLTLGAFT